MQAGTRQCSELFPHVASSAKEELPRIAFANLRQRVAGVLRGMDFLDATVIDETTQRVACRMDHLLDKFDANKATLNHYLFRCIRLVALEGLRFEHGPVLKAKKVERLGDTVDVSLDRAGLPSDSVEIEELFQLALSWMDELPAAQRDAVILTFLCPVRSPESPEQARNRRTNCCRGLKRLRARAARV
jgi:DNA-directed RNA polymerase specialized sigma24 family protein